MASEQRTVDGGASDSGPLRSGSDEAQGSLLRVLLDLTADAIMRFDAGLRYNYVNDRTVEMTGIPHDAWIGSTQAELGYPADEVAVREARLRHVFSTGESASYVDEFYNVEGRRFYEDQLFPQFDDQGTVTHVVVVARDITDRALAEEELRRAARTDHLTGPANRAALLEFIDEALEQGNPSGLTAVLLVDLDHFKYVNDSLGHEVGDQFLCAAAERIHGIVGDQCFVARHGGDEFVVVLPDIEHPGRATDVAEQLVEAFRTPLSWNEGSVASTMSVGIAWERSGAARHDANDLLREADTAMFVAKEAGRDGLAVFDDDLQRWAGERVRIATELRHATQRDELEVWYQPEVDLQSGDMHAVEALLRWRHPSGEIYAAGRFVDIAAETGLIVDIGYESLAQLCVDLNRWATEKLTVRLNLAPRQLAAPDLLDQLDRRLGEHGVDPRALCVEITETALLHDHPTVRRNLTGLAARGLSLAVDDFGIGYGSLTYLRRYAIDVIKIDRSFVTDIASDRRSRDLVAAVIALASHLGIAVTAEGIETTEQATVLRELGCPTGQGFLFSRAVPAHEIDSLLESSRIADPKI